MKKWPVIQTEEAKQKARSPQGSLTSSTKRYPCPIHWDGGGRVTNWMAEDGLDPWLIECQCTLGNHAFYILIEKKEE